MIGDHQRMSDFYEEWAAETLSVANGVDPADRDPYEEAASELLALARLAREAS
jgi:hypothetical protein